MAKILTVFRMAILIGFLSAVWVGQIAAQETDAQRAARMAWWRDAQFGLFVHWGLYAIPAGVWPLPDGTYYPTTSEWIMADANIPKDEYAKLAGQFNPQQFDAAEWVRLAKEAGMRYLIVTAKHHDGFPMWPSKYSPDFSLKRDILQELSQESAKQGIKFGLYYSILDWHHPAFDINPDPPYCGPDDLNRQSPCPPKYGIVFKNLRDKPAYLNYMYGQLQELIDNYHPAILWFDGDWFPDAANTGPGLSCQDSVNLYTFVRSLKPDIIINDRGTRADCPSGSGPNDLGDFATPEQKIPDVAPATYWETVMSINNNWGYNAFDTNWKSSETLIQNLTDITSKDGNYLLSVGPTADGIVPQPSVDRLQKIGEWLTAPALIQSNFGQRGNFEMLIRQGGRLCHYWRENDAPGFPWHPDPVTEEPTCFGENIEFAPAFIQGNFGQNLGQKGNFEVVVAQWDPEDKVTVLCHYWRDNGNDEYPWSEQPTACFAPNVTSAPALIQSNFGQQGNFEVVVQQGAELCHYWRANDEPPNYPWSDQPTACFAADVTSAPALIQANNLGSASSRGDFEVVARVKGQLCLFSRNNDDITYPYPWNDQIGILPECFGDEVTSAPALIQSRALSIVGNFEVVAREGTLLRHYFRNNDTDGLWYESEPRFGEEVSSAPALIQSRNLGAIGNFEVVVREAPSEEVGNPVHIWRDNNTFFPNFYPWYKAETVPVE